MKFFKHTGNYYLKKIQKGQFTIQQVADTLNTTTSIVNAAYIKYCEEQNPFKKTSFVFKNATIQICISIISTVLVLLTLFEMQAQRNATYFPDISLNQTEVAIAWNKNGLLDTNISDETKQIISKIANTDTQINVPPQLKIYNIGVGTAKDITFVWDTKKM